MRSVSLRVPLLFGLWGVFASTAGATSLEERLVAQGDRLVPNQVVDRDANRLWTLLVTPSVDVDAVAAAGATVDWAWPARGMMMVRGPASDLGETLAGVAGVRAVEATTTAQPIAYTLARAASSADETIPWANGPDVYRENAQWPLYAIGAVEPVPADDTLSGWTPGEWKLAYDGTGITVGSVDTGGPTLFCDPVDVRVELAVPAWGVCALFGAEEVDGSCVAPDAELGPVDALCLTLGELAGADAAVDADACRFDDVGLADFYAAFTGYDYLGFEAIAAWFRPHRLHPDFDWYQSVADIAATPELGAAGGVIPLFGTLDDYRAYRDDRYLAWRIPAGLSVVEQELAFAGVQVALTDAFAEALEAGEVGACSTADPRLPDPDALTWEAYGYALFDAPFDREGAYLREGWNGYDEAGELRVILDPTLVPVDMFGVPGDTHGTSTAGPLAGRYRPDGPYWGASRGVAPGVKLISYPGTTGDFAFAAAWRRAVDDGVLVLNNSWVTFFDFQRRAYGTITGEALASMALLAVEQAGGALEHDALLVISAGNYAVPLDDVRHDQGWVTYFDALPHALVVGGTGPRDYHWTDDIPAWMPDAQPHDGLRRAQNLDRPMIVWVEDAEYADGTAMGRRIDLVAPGGSFYMPSDRCGDDAFCYLSGWDDMVFVPDAFDWTDWYIGPHNQATGTSFSAPYAAGVAALAAEAWAGAHGDLPSPTQLKSILMTSAAAGVGPRYDEVALTDLTTEVCSVSWQRVEKPGPDEWMGAGRLDAPAAIARAER